MIYLILSTICLCLPWVRRYGIVPFVCLLMLLPVGNAMSLYFYKGGIYFFDFYFLSLFIRLVAQSRLAGRWAAFGGGLIGLYLLAALGMGARIDIYFLRDVRLLLYLATLMSLVSLQRCDAFISGRQIKGLACLAGLSCVVYASLTARGAFHFEDEFYVRNAFRYFAVSSYFCFGFIAFGSFLPAVERRGLLYHLALGASLAGILLTGFRVMVFVALMLFVIGALKSRRGSALAFMLLLLGAPFLAFSQGGELSSGVIARLNQISAETILLQLHIRFQPFFLEFSQFRPWEVFFGGGSTAVSNPMTRP